MIKLIFGRVNGTTTIMMMQTAIPMIASIIAA
ncbi:hypothetical protein QE422_002291 [Chryseobacterium sp. SORGH_AS 447]|nr:hypothetical protein [Chryseobacterium sp. SORGH_AS_0447]